jgi:hypothetical protein
MRDLDANPDAYADAADLPGNPDPVNDVTGG